MDMVVLTMGLRAIDKNQTWELVSLPHNKKPIGGKWVYKVKVKPSKEVAKYKVRLVAKGFLQRAGLNDNEVLACSQAEFQS